MNVSVFFCLRAVISVFRWKTFEAAEKSRRTKDDAILPTVFFSLCHSAAVSRVLQFNSAPITLFFFFNQVLDLIIT